MCKRLLHLLSRYHGGKITLEQPPPGESQENGRVEEAGKTLRGYIKVFKDMLEHRTGQHIPTGAAILCASDAIRDAVRYVCRANSSDRLILTLNANLLAGSTRSCQRTRFEAINVLLC